MWTSQQSLGSRAVQCACGSEGRQRAKQMWSAGVPISQALWARHAGLAGGSWQFSLSSCKCTRAHGSLAHRDITLSPLLRFTARPACAGKALDTLWLHVFFPRDFCFFYFHTVFRYPYRALMQIAGVPVMDVNTPRQFDLFCFSWCTLDTHTYTPPKSTYCSLTLW